MGRSARPWTVWTTQAIAGVMCALLAFGVVLAIGNVLNPKGTSAIQDPGFIPALLAALGFIYLITVIGLALRSFVGRWFGVAGLLLPAGLGTLFIAATVLSKRGLQDAMIFYDRMAFLLLTIGSTAFFGFLAYRLSRGVREKAFFSPIGPAHTAPPPPPSFETENTASQ